MFQDASRKLGGFLRGPIVPKKGKYGNYLISVIFGDFSNISILFFIWALGGSRRAENVAIRSTKIFGTRAAHFENFCF